MINVVLQTEWSYEATTQDVDDKGSDSLLPSADSQADWINRTKTCVALYPSLFTNNILILKDHVRESGSAYSKSDQFILQNYTS